jgi:hypothetical protein
MTTRRRSLGSILLYGVVMWQLQLSTLGIVATVVSVVLITLVNYVLLHFRIATRRWQPLASAEGD